jgi:hypothetical protein
MSLLIEMIFSVVYLQTFKDTQNLPPKINDRIICKVSVGALAYADDIVIIVPSACAMRKLLNVCDNYANEYHIAYCLMLRNPSLAFLSKNRRYLSEHLISGLFNIGDNPTEFA